MGIRIANTDSEGFEITRGKTTKSGWHYEPRFITFKTGTYLSVNNKNAVDQSDIADATLRFFDSSNNELLRSSYASDELFQTALTESCTKTFLEWQTTYDFDIRAGKLLNGLRPTSPTYAYAIVAPDIPPEYGGSIPHLNGGIPLHLIESYGVIPFEGITVKSVVADPVYNSNKFRVIVTHAVGLAVEMAISFEQYKA